MNIGDEVMWRGHTWRVRGIDPVSVRPQLVYLEHSVSGRQVNVEREVLHQSLAAARDIRSDWELHGLEE